MSIIEYYVLCSVRNVLHVIVPLILIKLYYGRTHHPHFQMGEMEDQRGSITYPELQNSEALGLGTEAKAPLLDLYVVFMDAE